MGAFLADTKVPYTIVILLKERDTIRNNVNNLQQLLEEYKNSLKATL